MAVQAIIIVTIFKQQRMLLTNTLVLYLYLAFCNITDSVYIGVFFGESQPQCVAENAAFKILQILFGKEEADIIYK